MRYDLAIFDMDGTILNTIEDLCDSTNYALETNGYAKRTLEEVKSFVGNGIRKLIEKAVPKGCNESDVSRVFETFKEYYACHCAVKTAPYNGIIATINELKHMGVKVAVVSNKANFAVQSLCEDYFSGLFDYAIGEKEGMNRKPYPDMVNEVLDKLAIKRERAVYIGDSEVDLKTSQNAQMDVIMVGWGFREKDYILELGAPFVIDSPDEIISIIGREI